MKDFNYSILLNRHLILTNDKYEDSSLTLLGKDDLQTNFWWMGHLKMMRNNKKQITGFEVNDGRIMHLRFNKIE